MGRMTAFLNDSCVALREEKAPSTVGGGGLRLGKHPWSHTGKTGGHTGVFMQLGKPVRASAVELWDSFPYTSFLVSFPNAL